MDGLSPEARLRGAGATEHRIDMLRSKGALRLDDEEMPARPLPLLDPRTWTTPAPPRRWIVPEWVPAEVVTALYGDGGIGKSLAALQLLTSTSLGAPWLGLEVMRGRALGIFCEDAPDELQRRQEGINASLGIVPGDLGNLRLLSRLGADNALVRFDGGGNSLTPFHAELRATCEEWRPDLLVLDTAADLYPDNENDRSKVRWFIQTGLASIARDFKCGLVLLAHPSVAGLTSGSGTGGSTAWNNTVRSRLYLQREEGDAAHPDARLLSRKKSNYGPRDAELRLIWRNGVLARAEAEGAASSAPAGLPWPTIWAMFDELQRAWSAGQPWSHRPETRRNGRYFPAWAMKNLNVPEKKAATLLSDWLMNGYLAAGEVDRHSKAKGLQVLRRLAP